MNNYQEYAVIEAKIKALTAQKDELRVKILEEMIESGEKKVVTEVGQFTVTPLKTWEYPDAVIELGEEFKAAKAKAESTGDATFTEKPSIRFTPVKL